MLLGAAALAAAAPPDAAGPASADTALPPVAVTVRRPEVQRFIDRTTYDVTLDLQSATGSAADVLNRIPSVEVDPEGAVTLRGSPKITILVDGKPSAELSGAAAGDGLLNFPASDIERIEVMNNPPPEFKAEGSGGVINIITHKERAPGGTATLRANAGNRGRYNLGASGSWNDGSLSLSGGVNFRHNVRERQFDSMLFALDPATVTPVASSEHATETQTHDIPSLRAGIGYRFNARQELSLSLVEREIRGPRDAFQTDRSATPAGTPVSASTRSTDGHERRLTGSQTLRFSQVLRHPGETLDLSLHHTSARDRDHYAYDTLQSLPPRAARLEDLYIEPDQSTRELSIDYALRLAHRQRLKFGYDDERQRSALERHGDTLDAATGQPQPSAALSDDFRFDQRIQALYGSFESNSDDWGLLLGGRLERAATDTRQPASGQGNSRRDTRFYPSLHLERYLAGDATLALAASRRVTRPTAQMLDPYVDTQASHFLVAGNPALLPEDSQALELSCTGNAGRRGYGITAYLHRDRSAISELTTLVNADTLLATRTNLPEDRYGGLEFTLDGPLDPQWSFRLSGNLFRAQVNGVADTAGRLRTTSGLNAKAGLDWQPTAEDTAQVALSRTDRRLTAQGSLGEVTVVNFGYKHRLSREASLVATLADAFEGQRVRRDISTSALTYEDTRARAGRVFYLGVVYRFGAPHRERDQDRETERDQEREGED